MWLLLILTVYSKIRVQRLDFQQGECEDMWVLWPCGGEWKVVFSGFLYVAPTSLELTILLPLYPGTKILGLWHTGQAILKERERQREKDLFVFVHMWRRVEARRGCWISSILFEERSLSEPRAHLSYGKQQSEQSCLCSPKRPDYRHLPDTR